MKKKRRTIGEILASIIRGLITLILSMLLVVSVTVNILFYREDAMPRIDFMDYHYTFFINNSDELSNIEKGALVIADHKREAMADSYIICTIGSGYKTVLALSEIVENENGSVSYRVRGSKDSSTINHLIPQTKYIATVYRKNYSVGQFIEFLRKITGIISFMAIPAFLLILLSVSGIRRNRMRYDDDLLESEILAEELRKAQREEKRINERKKKPSVTDQPGYENASAPELLEKIESAPIIVPTEDQVDDSFEEEVNKKAIEIKKALFSQTQENVTAEEPKQQVAVEPEPVLQTRVAEPEIKPEPERKPEKLVFQEPDYHPVYRQEPERVLESVEKMIETVVSTPTPMPAEKVVLQTEQPKPVAAEVQKPKIKKTAKRVTKKLDADSIDDLIKILDSEKKKLN